MGWLSTVWDEAKQVAKEWVDYDNFQSELEAEQQVQLAETQTQQANQPIPQTGGVLAQATPWVPWIVGGVVLVFMGPKLLRMLK